jgi:hypothetical protein
VEVAQVTARSISDWRSIASVITELVAQGRYLRQLLDPSKEEAMLTASLFALLFP